jgi:hypothetical protein
VLAKILRYKVFILLLVMERGGESVYGIKFEDENFILKNEC